MERFARGAVCTYDPLVINTHWIKNGFLLQNRASILLRFVEQTVILLDFFHQNMEYLRHIFTCLTRTFQVWYAH